MISGFDRPFVTPLGVGRGCVGRSGGGPRTTVIADHSDDIVMFDVPPSEDRVRGIAAYRKTCPPFFTWQRQVHRSRSSRSTSAPGGRGLRVRAAALRHARGARARPPGNRLRLTVGLQRDGDRWVVTHEPHSFPRQDLTEGADRATNPQLSPHEPRRTDRTYRGVALRLHRRPAGDVVGDIGGETATSEAVA
jgi:ketosteroid isomerase-like protein